MATYVNYVGGPRQPGQVDGPDEFHLVILDNGRSKILADPELREILGCIRCAACLNVCPVYAKIGGHAYGFAYSGPVGTVITPLLTGINQAKDLCLGETLCGACKEICPVDIDLPRLILALRAKLADGDPDWDVTPVSRMEKGGMVAWSKMIQNRKRYDQSLKLARLGQNLLPGKNGRIHRLLPPFSGWTVSRDLKQVADESFNAWWRKKGWEAGKL
jgi:L-lactate dehydrogenase complex protein LldF